MSVKTILDMAREFMPDSIDEEIVDFLTRHYNTAIASPYDPHDYSNEWIDTRHKVRSWDPWVGNIENQLNYPRCVGQSWEVVARINTNNLRGADVGSGKEMADYDAQAFYELCKQNDGIPDALGTYPITGAKMARKYGLTENKPKKGEVFTIERWWRNKNVRETSNNILTTGPVALTMRIFPSFWTNKGILKKPGSKEKSTGLHNVCGTYRGDGFTSFVNSHGEHSGDFGRFIVADEFYDDYFTESIGSY